eukprot:8051582-Ditylum_brightwellii.AAC.1
MERSKQNKCVVGNKDNGVSNGVDNSNDGGVDNSDDDSDDDSVGNSVDDSVDDSVDNSVDNGDDGANKHPTNLSQAADCCLMERSKQNKCVIGNKDD